MSRIPLRRLRHALSPAVARLLVRTARSLRREELWELSGAMAAPASALPSRSLRTMRRHRRTVMEPLGLEATDFQVLRSILFGVLDFLHLTGRPDGFFRELVEVRGEEHMAGALERGRGCLALTAHYSSWELIPRAVALLGHPVGVVGRRLSHPDVSAMMDDLRRGQGAAVVDRGSGTARLMGLLRAGTAVGILIDQDTRGAESGFVRFLGVPARTPLGPARIALRFGVPVLTLHIARREDLSYILEIDGELETEGLTGPDAPLELTARASRRMEGWIRDDPEQWVWIHRRWAHRPAPGDVVR